MSVVQILQLSRADFQGTPTSLRKPSIDVEKFDDEFKSRLKDLIDTFESHKIAVGLSAPQIGCNLRFFIVNVNKGKLFPHRIIVNPTVLETGRDREAKYESCMSLPDYKGPVERSFWIKISYKDENGKVRSDRYEGFLARVIQHEMDHLDGILFVDRMVSIEKLEQTDLFKKD
jgi:peptide deformylase